MHFWKYKIFILHMYVRINKAEQHWAPKGQRNLKQNCIEAYFQKPVVWCTYFVFMLAIVRNSSRLICLSPLWNIEQCSVSHVTKIVATKNIRILWGATSTIQKGIYQRFFGDSYALSNAMSASNIWFSPPALSNIQKPRPIRVKG